MLALVILLVPTSLFAQPDLANISARIPSVDNRGTAVGGYDAVAFFDYGEATQGTQDFRTDHAGFRYVFASKVNLKKFMGNPERYAPAYGGYCAMSLSAQAGEFENRKPGLYVVDPTIFKIVNERLYLFSSPKALEKWSENEAGNIASADANWNAILAARQQ